MQPLENADDIQYDYTRFQNDTAKRACDVVSDFLHDIGIRNKITFQKVVSPREYNFSTDSVDVDIELNMMDLGRAIIKHYDEIEREIKERFTSRSGFFSFVSNDIWEWREDWNNNNFDEPRCIGALLEILLAIKDYDYFPFFHEGMEFEEFVPEFGRWLRHASLGTLPLHPLYFGAT